MALTIRQQEILEYLKKHKFARTSELTENLFVSPATIRRELHEMKKMGLVERQRGGAIVMESAEEVAIHIRYMQASADKRQTAEIALKYLPDFRTAFFDNSSTALILAERLDFQHKTVITNGLSLAVELSKKENVNVVVPCGNLIYNSNALSGAMTLKFLADMHFGIAICSCAAISPEGTYENSPEQNELKRIVIENSTHKVLLVDKTKFKRESVYRTVKLSRYDVIFTNADDRTIEPFKKLHGVRIINKLTDEK